MIKWDLKKTSVTPDDSFDLLIDLDEDKLVERNIDDVLQEIRDHLTKEELLWVSLYKNSKRQRNMIYRVFLKKYYGKILTTSAITKRKKRMFKVLECIGQLLRFKRTNGVDVRLKKLLTKKQFVTVLMYERRWTISTIQDKLKLGKEHAIIDRYYRAVGRLKKSEDPFIAQYLVLLGDVLRFSRKFPKSKQ